MFTQREKMIFGATVLTFTGAVAFQWLAQPLANRQKALDGEISAAKTRLARVQGLASHKQGLIETYARVFPERGAACSAGSPDTAQPLLSQIDVLAQQAGIRILDIRPQDAGADGGAAEETVDVRAEGELANIIRFIAFIERSSAHALIQRFQLSVKPNSGMLEASFTLAGDA